MLPKELTEKDRALMAYGLIKTLGEESEVTNYFEVPGYKLRHADPTRKGMEDEIRKKISNVVMRESEGMSPLTLDSRLRARITS